MTLQVVHLHQRFAGRDGKSLCIGSPHKEGAKKSGTTCECYGIHILHTDTGIFQSLVYYRNYIGQMSPGRKFRDHASPFLVHFLACYHAGQQVLVFQHGG